MRPANPLAIHGATSSESKFMKTIVYLFLLMATVFLTGCAMDPDDKAFFEKGWLHPGMRDPR